MKCEHWIKIPSNYASTPQCAFNPDGSFNRENWSCALMDVLRAACEKNEVWQNDSHLAIGSYDEDSTHSWFVLQYYKHRGRTDGFWIPSENGFQEGRIEDAILFYNENKNNESLKGIIEEVKL